MIEKCALTFPLYRAVRYGRLMIPTPPMPASSKGVPKILMSNVAEVVSGEGRWGLAGHQLLGLPCAAPFTAQWLEMVVPRNIGFLNPLTNAPPKPPPGGTGIVVGAIVISFASWEAYWKLVTEATGQAISTVPEIPADQGLLFALHEGAWKGGRFEAAFKGSVTVPLDENYMLVPAEGGQVQWLSTLPKIYSRLSEETQEIERADLSNCVSIFLYGLAMLHCKNIQLTERTFQPSPVVKSVLKYTPSERREFGRIKYHVLRVDTPKPPKGAKRASGLDHPERSLHICRGHFRTYGADRPLFGRFVGTYWIPAHTRGVREVGVVLKDYDEHIRV